MKDQDWDIIYQVHLKGSYKCARAAWEHMRNQKYGRIIMVTSAAGLYGNFGQANYSAMKLALVGLASTLSIEGAKLNIKCNTIAPLAGSRMTETIMPADLVAALKPEYVVPLVAYLTHESAESSGGIFEVGAGWISKVRWQRTKGHIFEADKLTPEAIRDNWNTVTEWKGATNPTSAAETINMLMTNLQSKKSGGGSAGAAKKAGNDAVDVEKAMAFRFPPQKLTYGAKECAIYALSVGDRPNPAKSDELSFVYENHQNFKALPGMAVSFCLPIFEEVRNEIRH